VDGYFIHRDWEFRHSYGQNNYWNVGGMIHAAGAYRFGCCGAAR